MAFSQDSKFFIHILNFTLGDFCKIKKYKALIIITFETEQRKKYRKLRVDVQPKKSKTATD